MLVNSNKSTPNALSALSLLVSTTLADQVADRIVDAIIAREFVSGTRLIETELATARHVSVRLRKDEVAHEKMEICLEL
jgi:hypothetical protein